MAKHAKPPPQDDTARLPSADRRRWLKAGLSTTPVLMTVASRPVLAEIACKSPSNAVSSFASAPGMLVSCYGLEPDAWAESGNTRARRGDTLARSSGWPGPYGPDSLFNDYFVPTLNGKPTFLDVLGHRNIPHVTDDIHMVARYVTTALLNHAAGKVPGTVLSETAIRTIWSEYARTGSFAPTRGVSWSATEIVEYLKSTMPGG